MIIAFSPEQAHEVSQAFNAPWFLNESLFEDFLHKEEDSNKKESHHESSPSKTTADAADTKPPAKKTMGNSKKACRPNNHCNNRANMTFRPCFRYNNLAARCNRQQQAKSASLPHKRIIDQKTPIHLHEETPDAARMSLDITGFTPQDVTITVEDHVVFVKGERTNRLGDVFVLDRKFRLDKKTALVDEVTATFDNDGILEITVPKKSLVGPRTIPILVSPSRTSDESASELEDQEEKNEKDTSVSVSITEDSIVTEPTTQEAEDPQSMEGSNHSNQRRSNAIDHAAVKTVHEIERHHNEEKVYVNDESQSISTATHTTSNKSTEDEAWEEVSK